MAKDVIKLNAAQEQAVMHKDGPIMVVAGAGTGKTRVIVERIMRLIDGGVAPESILALTFTEKAAGEMLDRINERRGGYTLDMTVATYNGFGNDLLQGYAAEIGLGSSFRLLGDTGQLVFLREHLDEFELDYFAPVSRPDGQLSLLADYISRLKQQLIQPVDYRAFASQLPASSPAEQLEKQKHQELARFYETYLCLCRESQVIDYDDQLFLSIELLTRRPNIKHEMQQKYAYILVDEFQDTNPMQSALLDLLTGEGRNIMIVGDDDQSIYGWRGATLANILGFKERYPDTNEVTLIDNYRSSQAILDASYELIQQNNPDRLEVMNKLDKRLVSHAGNGSQPVARRFTTFDAEITWVAEDIARRLKAGQNPGSIAVLARRNHGVQRMHDALELQGVEHTVAGLSNDLYRQPAVSHLIEAVTAIADPLDNMALFHTLGGPLYSIPQSELAVLAAASRREHETLDSIIMSSDNEPAKQATAQLQAWRETMHEHTVGALAYNIVTDTGWKQQLYRQAETDPAVLSQVIALNQFFKTLKEFERIAAVASAANYLANLPVLSSAGSELQDASLEINDDTVNVLSVHRAKGLEWDTVYIIDCIEGSFPMRAMGGSLKIPEPLITSTAADDHMAEERRLMYVAATRARHELILTHADTHTGTTKRRPSRFLKELLGSGGEAALQGEEQQISMELFAPAAPPQPKGFVPEHLKLDGWYSLSVSQVDCFLRCPQDFYYIHVLQMPLPADPALKYGTIMHGVIQAIHEGRRNGRLPNLTALLNEAEHELPTQGYSSKRSRERAHAQARRTIQEIYKRFSSSALPAEIELPFNVKIPGAPLTLRGRIDAVYPQADGKVEIRDYKTGTSVTDADKAKRRASGSNQLTLYALAWQLTHGDLPGMLTLDFIETGQAGSVKKQQKSIETMLAKLAAMVQAIEAGKYTGGNDHSFCSHPLS